MGASFTKLFNALTSTKEQIGLLLVGLGGSGKTTIIYKLKLGEIVKTGVTIGVHDTETLEYKTIGFNAYDVGGQSDGPRGVPLLVVANKQDLPDAMDAEEVTDKLGFRLLPHPHLWHVQRTSVITGEGLHEGLDWLASHVVNKK